MHYLVGGDLCLPDDWSEEERGCRRYPLSRAIATLKRLRDVYEATGKIVVDWGPELGEAPAGKPWAAPVVSPNLPISLTKALHGVDPSLAVEEPVAS